MNKHFGIILGLSLLIIPYQNCSNPISFTNSDIAKAELLAEDESDIPNHLPEQVEDNTPIRIMPPEEREDDEKGDDQVGIPPMPPAPIGPPETCGSYFAVYALENDHGKEMKRLGVVKAFSNIEMSAKENYAYHGYSAHPVVGPRITGKSTKMFLLESKDGLNLNIIFNEDNGGSKKNSISWKVNIDDNKLEDSVMFMDDPNNKQDKIEKIVVNNHESRYVMKFSYYSNTDGVILGPLRNTARIMVNPAHSGEAGLGSKIIGPNGAVNLPIRNKNGELEKFMLVGLDDMNCTQ